MAKIMGLDGKELRIEEALAITILFIQLSAANLRSVDLQISGSGLGSWTRDEVKELFHTILPEAFQLAADGKLVVDTVGMLLKHIEKVWDMNIPDGKRLVITI